MKLRLPYFWRKSNDHEGIEGSLVVRSTLTAHRAAGSDVNPTHVQFPKNIANHYYKIRHWKNGIRTSHYRWWNFLILNVLEQCMVASNMYFIVMGLLQCIPSISDSGGVPTFFVPVGFVMMVTMLKDCFEDIKRHRSDHRENNSTAHRLSAEGRFEDCKWQSLRPGDIVKIYCDEVFPADLLLLVSSESYGISYVETVQLDGETNLKIKTSIPEVDRLASPAGTGGNTGSLKTLSMEIVMGPPTPIVYQFNGLLVMRSPSKHLRTDLPETTVELLAIADADGANSFPVTVGQFLWRGATLRATQHVIAMVLYTGHKSRIFMNTRSRRLKASSLMRKYNSHILWTGAVQILLCLLGSILAFLEIPRMLSYWYLMPGGDEIVDSSGNRSVSRSADSASVLSAISSLFVGFGRYLLLLSQFVPITLIIQMELAHWVQALFIYYDRNLMTPCKEDSPPITDMADATGTGNNKKEDSTTAGNTNQEEANTGTGKKTDGKKEEQENDAAYIPTTCNSVNLLDEFGCVTHVFSDKTGTLTQNLMQLQTLSIGLQLWPFDGDEGHEPPPIQELSPYKYVNFDARQFNNSLSILTADEKSLIRDFLLCLALCHSVVVSKKAPACETLCPCILEGSSPHKDDKKAHATASPRLIHTMPLTSDDISPTPPRPLTGESDNDGWKRAVLESLSGLEPWQPASPLAVPEPNYREADSVSSSSHTPSGGAGPTPLSRRPAQPAQPTQGFVGVRRRELSSPVLAEIEIPVDTGNPTGSPTGSSDPRRTPIISLEEDTVEPPPLSGFNRWWRRVFHTGMEAPLHAAVGREKTEIMQTAIDALPVAIPEIPSLDLQRTRFRNYRNSVSQPESPNSSHHTRYQPSTPPATPADSLSPRSQLQQFRTQQIHGSSLHSDSGSPLSPPNMRTTLGRRNTASIRLSEAILPEPLASVTRMPLQPSCGTSWSLPSALPPPLPPQPPSGSNTHVLLYPLARRRRADFDASSPDEVALSCGSKHIGLELIGRPSLDSVQIAPTEEAITRLLFSNAEMESFYREAGVVHLARASLRVGDAPINATEEYALLPALTFEVLDVLDFDNVRKRMSVIVRDRGGRILMLTKGADSQMFKVAAGEQREMIEFTNVHLDEMSRRGLRTLVFGMKEFSEAEYAEFDRNVAVARLSTSDTAEEELMAVYDAAEMGQRILGASGINDRLQDEVAETISAVREAGVQVWVLTGDKLETAISIGHSCSILPETTFNAIVNGSTSEEVKAQMHQYMLFIVAAQLCKAAFDRLSPAEEDENDSGVSTQQCCRLRRKKKTPGHRQPRNKATMTMDEFLKILRFEALRGLTNRKKKGDVRVVTESPDLEITAEQADVLIQTYLASITPDEETMKRQRSKKLKGPFVGEGKHRGSGTKSSGGLPFSSLPADSRGSTEFTNPRGTSNLLDDDTPAVERYESVSLTITGDALNFALESEENQKYFFGLANLCTTVIACRVTPKQKAEVIAKCKKYAPCRGGKSFCSLAIGDGANDVNMILTADVGVGIRGKEGLQAARSADIAIGQFKYLRNLMFFYGHENLRRNSVMMYHTLWKNIYFGSVNFFYGFWNMFSAADIYDSWLKQIFNLVFTPGPVMFFAWFDRMLPYDIFMKTSLLYPLCTRPDGKMYFGRQFFFWWFLYALFAGAVATNFILLAFNARPASRSGKVEIGFDDYGVTVFFTVVIVGNISIVPFIHTWYSFTFGVFLFEVFCWYFIWVLQSYAWMEVDLYGSTVSLNTAAAYHLVVFIVVMITILPVFLWYAWRTVFKPTAPVIIRERIKRGVHDVVVQTTPQGGVGVVVPRQKRNGQWKGFAFSEEPYVNRLTVMNVVEQRIKFP